MPFDQTIQAAQRTANAIEANLRGVSGFMAQLQWRQGCGHCGGKAGSPP
jgi:hypothetical protein